MLTLDLEKVAEPEIKLPTFAGSLKKQESSRKKHLLLLCWLHQSLWLCGSQQSVKNSERWEYQTTWPASWEICMQVRKQQLEQDREQQTGSKLGKEYVKAAYCHPASLTSMQSIWWETLDWMKHKLESRLLGEVSITSDTEMAPPLWQKWRRSKQPLDESETGEWKSWLKAQHSEN